MDYKGKNYLARKLTSKRTRVLKRYEFYEMKDRQTYYASIVPSTMREMYEATSGWCAKSVDSIADRLQFREFENDVFDIQEIFDRNNPDVFFDSAVLGALISSCDFVYITKDAYGYPEIEVIDGANATGIIDTRTGLLKEGYAVLSRDDKKNPILEAYFQPGVTWYYKVGEKPWSIRNNAEFPLLVPIIYRPDAIRPFGHSRISRTCMYLQAYAKRTMLRSDVSAEFYSFPQKYALGTDPDSEQLEKWRATMSSFLQFDKDEQGDHPVLGQFQQQSMSPFIDQLRMAASIFAGETGLTVDDLGFPSDNPSSQEAIKASHENLRLMANRAKKTFGSAFRNVGFLCTCLRDDFAYNREAFLRTKAIWEPTFETDFSSLGVMGDSIQKINSVIPGYFDRDNVYNLTGIRPSDNESTQTVSEPVEEVLVE